MLSQVSDPRSRFHGVTERVLSVPISEFEQKCFRMLDSLWMGNVTRSGNRLDIFMIEELLADSIRLARQHADFLSYPCQCQIYETCDRCRIQKVEPSEQLSLPIDS